MKLTADCDMIACECCTCYEDGQLVSTYMQPSPDSPTPAAPVAANTPPSSWTDYDQEVNRPTRAPNSLFDRDIPAIRAQIESGVLQRGATFDGMEDSDPRYLALDWLLSKDIRQLTTDDENLSQRYILGLLAFAFDSLAWYVCGEHRTFGNVTEDFANEDCAITYATGQVESHKVWLSSADECDWYGVVCSSDGVVRGVELSELMRSYCCCNFS